LLARKKKKQKERAAYHLARLRRTTLRCSQRAGASESREVYTPSRGTPPSRLTALCCAAQLREMAL